MTDEHRSHTDRDHNHTHSDDRNSTRLALVSAINLLGFFGELAGGLLFGSVALLSDAFHMLFDAMAYVMLFGVVCGRTVP